MKKIIAITVVALSIFTQVFAFDGRHVLPFNSNRAFVFNVTEVTEKIAHQFNSEFQGASYVTWEVTEDYSKASFIWNGAITSSFYDDNGDWVATAQVVQFDVLPQGTLEAVNNKYKGYDVQLAVRLDRPYHKQPSFFVFVIKENKRILLEVREKGWVRRANVTYL